MSTKVDKLFVKRDHVVPFQMKWDRHVGLSVRALMLFTEPDNLKTAVKTCANHKEKDNPTNPSEFLMCT